MKKSNNNKKELKPAQREELLNTLKVRFEKNKNRHKGIEWAKVQAKLEANTEKLWSLNEMERTGGEPDIVGYDKKTTLSMLGHSHEHIGQSIAYARMNGVTPPWSMKEE